MKKITFLALFLLINIAILYFAFVNFHTTLTYICIFNHKAYSISLGLFTLILAFAADTAGFLYAVVLQENIVKLCGAYQKKNEHISVKSEEDSATIKALEAKIETLEAALKQAFNKD